MTVSICVYIIEQPLSYLLVLLSSFLRRLVICVISLRISRGRDFSCGHVVFSEEFCPSFSAYCRLKSLLDFSKVTLGL